MTETGLMAEIGAGLGNPDPEEMEATPAYKFIKGQAAELHEMISAAASSCDISFGVKKFLENVLDYLSDEEKCSLQESQKAIYKFLGEGV